MRPDDLSVDTSYVNGAAVVTVCGELDMHTAPLLGAALEQVGADQRVLVDLASLHFMDSSGLKVLLADRARRLAGGGSLYICDPSAPVRRVVEMTGLGEFLFDGSVESAADAAHLTRDVTSTG